jgi:5-methylcytosine-specific restriction protein A
MPTTAEFTQEIVRQIAAAAEANEQFVDICSGDVHGIVGSYPDSNAHRMPVCCSSMRRLMQAGDAVLTTPESGNGASLVIRYQLPRNI